jgi:versiconal hemiacetal acetate esterase
MLKQWGDLGAALVSKLTFPPPDPSVHSEDKLITNGLKVRIYTPPTAPPNQMPVGLFIHGGGWAMGDLEVSKLAPCLATGVWDQNHNISSLGR